MQITVFKNKIFKMSVQSWYKQKSRKPFRKQNDEKKQKMSLNWGKKKEHLLRWAVLFPLVYLLLQMNICNSIKLRNIFSHHFFAKKDCFGGRSE